MSPYEQAFNRIRAEFMEMPGMRLTPEQVERLSGVVNSVCRLVLDDPVRAGVPVCGRRRHVCAIDRTRPYDFSLTKRGVQSASHSEHTCAHSLTLRGAIVVPPKRCASVGR